MPDLEGYITKRVKVENTKNATVNSEDDFECTSGYICKFQKILVDHVPIFYTKRA